MNKDVLKSKEAIVQEVSNSVKEADSFVICEYKGLTVKQISELRKALREKEAKATVYKNTLVNRAIGEEYKDLVELFEGSNMYFFCKEGTNGSLNLIAKFAKRNSENFKIKGGLIDGKAVDSDYIKELASLPNKEGLVSMLLSVLQAPMRNLAYSLSQVAEKAPANNESVTAEASAN